MKWKNFTTSYNYMTTTVHVLPTSTFFNWIQINVCGTIVNVSVALTSNNIREVKVEHAAVIPLHRHESSNLHGPWWRSVKEPQQPVPLTVPIDDPSRNHLSCKHNAMFTHVPRFCTVQYIQWNVHLCFALPCKRICLQTNVFHVFLPDHWLLLWNGV